MTGERIPPDHLWLTVRGPADAREQLLRLYRLFREQPPVKAEKDGDQI